MMRQYDAFNPITRRGLRIHYVSPFICQLGAEASGSGFGGSANLDIAPVNRLPGPASLSIEGNVLTWSTQPYIFAFVVYYSTSVAGPFSLLTSNVLATHFTVSGISPGDYFFKVTGIEPTAGETLPSPIVGPSPII
jgi:hypothetical protein